MPSTVDDTMRDDIVALLRPYASRIELYGSVARGDDTSDSDVDILVTLRPEGERPRLGLRWFELEEEVGQRLGRPVEIVTERALSPHVRPFIEPDRRVIYEDE
jgi:Predicted nucleotidyltransferases